MIATSSGGVVYGSCETNSQIGVWRMQDIFVRRCDVRCTMYEVNCQQSSVMKEMADWQTICDFGGGVGGWVKLNETDVIVVGGVLVLCNYGNCIDS